MNTTVTRNRLGFTGTLTLEEQHATAQAFLAEFNAKRVELTYHDGLVLRGLLCLDRFTTLENPTRGQCHPNDRVPAVVHLAHIEVVSDPRTGRKTRWAELGRSFGIALIADIKAL